MNLTSEQKTALLAAIAADQATYSEGRTQAQLYADSVYTELADIWNATASPAYVVWRTKVTDEEIMQNGFVWTCVDNLTVGKARIWEWLCKFGYINPSKSNVQAAIEAAFAGTSGDWPTMRAAIYGHCKRDATRIEKLFAAGNGTTASPSVMAQEGLIGWEDFQTLE